MNNKIQASDLEALSRRLGVEIGIFFAEASNAVETQSDSQYGEVSWLLEKIALLEQRIKDKDELIKIFKGQ